MADRGALSLFFVDVREWRGQGREGESDMDAEDFLTPEVGVTAVVVAALASKPARRVLRKELVYGLAGILSAGELVGGIARGIVQEVQQAGASVVAAAHEVVQEEGKQQEAGSP